MDFAEDVTVGLINCLRRVDKRNEKIIICILEALNRLIQTNIQFDTDFNESDMPGIIFYFK
jgi:hypothetical protein